MRNVPRDRAGGSASPALLPQQKPLMSKLEVSDLGQRAQQKAQRRAEQRRGLNPRKKSLTPDKESRLAEALKNNPRSKPEDALPHIEADFAMPNLTPYRCERFLLDVSIAESPDVAPGSSAEQQAAMKQNHQTAMKQKGTKVVSETFHFWMEKQIKRLRTAAHPGSAYDDVVLQIMTFDKLLGLNAWSKYQGQLDDCAVKVLGLKAKKIEAYKRTALKKCKLPQ